MWDKKDNIILHLKPTAMQLIAVPESAYDFQRSNKGNCIWFKLPGIYNVTPIDCDLWQKEIKAENENFRKDVMLQVKTLTEKTEKKHIPIHFEQNILQTAQVAITDSIKNVLSGYSSPLSKLIASVVDENSAELRQIISDSFTQVIRKDEFKQSIVEAFSHKIARTMISNNDGLFDKVANGLKTDSVFKSKITLAVSTIVEECLKKE